MHRLQKNTKIVATVGPSSLRPSVLQGMIKNGMNVARINCSHGNHASYEDAIQRIRKAAKKTNMPIAILLDLGGPKIRTGDFEDGAITLQKGRPFVFSTKHVVGDSHRVFVNYPKLPREVVRGMEILLDDGKCSLTVKRTTKTEVHCVVKDGGHIASRRGMNIPGAALSIPTISSKDKKDVLFGMKHGVDYLALSFVRSAKDIDDLRRILAKKKSTIKIVAKIETRQAVQDLDPILERTDAVMVARGDLAVEVPKEEVPILQKVIIEKARDLGRPVITATQMLDSMTTQFAPTRAEVSDVANAIFDGTDAVMLSQESAIGNDPVHVVATMASIAEHVEQNEFYREEIQFPSTPHSVVDAVGKSVSKCVQAIGAKAIVALTESGYTALTVARQRPRVPILVLTPHESTFRQLALSYATMPLIIRPVKGVHDALHVVRASLKKTGLAKKGDRYVIVAGVPFGHRGGTNTLIIQTMA